jgi:predicted  nucleic acid-binding Zn-ribbon protein
MEKWLARLDDEIEALPTVRRLEELAQRISDIEDAIKDLPDTYVTREQADELRRHLDDLEARWTAHMRETEAKAADLEERVSKLHAEIEMLKQVVDTATVRGLARLVAVRVWRYAKSPETPQQIATACESVKALTDGVTTMLGGA